MSDVKSNQVDSSAEAGSESSEEISNGAKEEAKTVAFKSYQKSLDQEKAAKAKARELEAQVNEYQAKLEAMENEKLAEQGKWKELAEKEREKAEQRAKELEGERSRFLEYHKKQAVIGALGGFKRDEYASFINVESISVDENGVPSKEGIEAEADRIRANHPELLKSNVSGSLNPEAPSVADQGVSKDYSQMTEAEKLQAKRKLLNKQ